MIDIDKQEAEEGKVISIFAYLGILFLIPLLAGKDNKFAQFHANQGLVLCLASFAMWIVYSILNLLFLPFGILGGILSMIIGLVYLVASLGILALMIIGIINVVNLDAKPLPVLGSITLIKSY
ncbi:hypothetical protein [Acetobacterium tundrae]|uniref:DUF4870 domain-containing protein n=1 Tax=Acetobacterium tundrae TaxID=132932 RepID=A0ABR6WPW7_9FIRM|nr:hypothetical protein [Acetobacterium tundrae]MBC3798343.1 hypothetical protein [Acetobacterium tundrae]